MELFQWFAILVLGVYVGVLSIRVDGVSEQIDDMENREDES